jgi:hypothetical protein
MRLSYKELILVTIAISIVATFAVVVYAAPQAGSAIVQNVSVSIRNITADAPGLVYAQGGNITHLNISQKVQSTNWAVFWGQVRKHLVLEAGTATDNSTMYEVYNWSKREEATTLASYVIFSNDSAVDWATGNIGAGTLADVQSEDKTLGINAADNVSLTYTDIPHSEIVIGPNTVAEGAAFTVNTSSSSEGFVWESVLLESNGGANGRLYTAVVQGNTNSYAGETADYQIMVPVNSATKQRTYYVYAALS